MNAFSVAALFSGVVALSLQLSAADGWLTWRGPLGTSVSTEKGLPQKLDAKAPLWSVDFPGQSTPVIADGRLYINGYQGDGQDLQEFLACFDAETGQNRTERRRQRGGGGGGGGR